MSGDEFDFPNVEPKVTVKYSEKLGSLAAALAKAQTGFRPIVKSVENSFYSTDKKKAKYADLSAIIAATQPSLAANELVIVQTPMVNAERREAGCVSRLIHSSGEWIENEVMLPATAKVKEYPEGQSGWVWGQKFDAQTCGIAMTYSRRYSYGGIVCVAAEEDDDGNAIGEAGQQGSTDTAQAIGKKKVEETKARMEAAKPNGNGGMTHVSQVAAPKAQVNIQPMPEELYGLLREVKPMKSKTTNKNYMALKIVDPQDREHNVSAFDDHKWEDGTTVFGLLTLAGLKKGGQEIRMHVKRNGNYTNMWTLLQLGDTIFDESGPIMKFDAPHEANA